MYELRPGKLDPARLADLLARHAAAATGRIVVPARLGEDAAVIELPDRYLVVATDPITFVTEDLGHYVVTVNANDVATAGARPLFFSCVLLFPAGATLSDVERVFDQVARACAEQQVAWVGGHTEVTPAVSAPLAVGQMIGEVERPQLVRKDSLRAGDRLLLTQGLAIEAVSIIARSRPEEVRRLFGQSFLERARAFLQDPGIGVVEPALAACAVGGVRALHDPTEGGLAGGLHELAAATGLGVVVRREAIPIYPEARTLCDHFGLDPLGVIASGSLIIGAAPGQAPAILEALEGQGIPCVEIGQVTADPGCRFAEGGPLPVFAVDEITRLF